MSKTNGNKNYHQSSQPIQRKNASHSKSKAKYPINIGEEKEGNIIHHHEHKRRLDTRNMLVTSIPLKIPIKPSNTCH